MKRALLSFLSQHIILVLTFRKPVKKKENCDYLTSPKLLTKFIFGSKILKFKLRVNNYRKLFPFINII